LVIRRVRRLTSQLDAREPLNSACGAWFCGP
jgi:hypothetical protein